MTDKNLLAVIDLGTNTAHLLIAKKKEERFAIVFRERHYTFLAENGIEHISNSAQNRLFAALKKFSDHVHSYQVNHIVIIATEAFRIASNGQQILNTILENYGWKVEILSGDQEAHLIYKGVSVAVNMLSGTYVVMDIGGGSVEFIISNNGKIKWKKSFSIGLAQLHNLEVVKDPLSSKIIDQIKDHIRNELIPLKNELKNYDDVQLIGAAGSFEILSRNLTKENDNYPKISRETFLGYLNEVIHLSEEERANLSWIPKERVKYVTMAIILIQVAIEVTGTKDILVSPYALKEGLITEYYNF